MFNEENGTYSYTQKMITEIVSNQDKETLKAIERYCEENNVILNIIEKEKLDLILKLGIMNNGSFLDNTDFINTYYVNGIETYKKENELLKQENEKLNHYKLLYQKVKERNDKAIKIMEDYTLFDLKADKVMQVINLLKGNEE